jgi:hypothetical protein
LLQWFSSLRRTRVRLISRPLRALHLALFLSHSLILLSCESIKNDRQSRGLLLCHNKSNSQGLPVKSTRTLQKTEILSRHLSLKSSRFFAAGLQMNFICYNQAKSVRKPYAESPLIGWIPAKIRFLLVFLRSFRMDTS